MAVLSMETVFAGTRFRMASTTGYLSAGKLLHAVTTVELLAIIIIPDIMGTHPLAYPVIMLLSITTLFTQLDARSRYQEYKKVRDQLIAHGPDRRIFKSVANSRCRRDAAVAAARQLGYAKDCRVYFTAAGYRWHHLSPDFVKSHPGFFFSTAFWRATFFARCYHARYSAPGDKRGLFQQGTNASACRVAQITNCG